MVTFVPKYLTSANWWPIQTFVSRYQETTLGHYVMRNIPNGWTIRRLLVIKQCLDRQLISSRIIKIGTIFSLKKIKQIAGKETYIYLLIHLTKKKSLPSVIDWSSIYCKCWVINMLLTENILVIFFMTDD